MLCKEVETSTESMIKIRTCHKCGVELENPWPNQKYCDNCKKTAYNEKNLIRVRRHHIKRRKEGLSANKNTLGTSFYLKNSIPKKGETIDFDKEKEKINKEFRALKLRRN